MAAKEASTQAVRGSQTRRRPPLRSAVWTHFTRFADDDGNENARCNRCSLVLGASTRNGTSTLRAHVRICGGGDQAVPASNSRPPRQMPVPPCAPSSSENASGDLARMIALHGYDSLFVEDDYFRCFVRRLNPEFEVPSRVAIENMCDGIFDEAKRSLLDRLWSAPGKVSLAVGRAKTMDEQVLYVACHFIDDGWNLHKRVLHAFVTTDHYDYHDGPILGLDVATYEMEMPVATVISDHCISNRVLMVADETTDKDIGPVLNHQHFSWAGLLANPNRKEIFFTTYVNNVLHSIARCLLPDDNYTSAVFDAIHGLSLTRQERLELLVDLDLHHQWAYDEHWYALYCSLQVLGKKGLIHDEFMDEELFVTKLLCKLWEKIYRAIKKFSSSTCPTGNLCLAELFKLREILQLELARFSNEDDEDVYYQFDDIKFVTSLKEANNSLDKAIQDSYLAWSLPLALDPRYKLKFITFNLERAYGVEEATKYVSKVTTMITELYADYVKLYGTAGGANHSDGASAKDTTTTADDPLQQAWNEHCRSQQAMTTQVTSGCYPEAETELDRYLNDPLVSQAEEGFDILKWWKVCSSKYPMVAKMARDALAMPTCSKLSSDQMAQVRGILRGYSKKPYGADPEELFAALSI